MRVQRQMVADLVLNAMGVGHQQAAHRTIEWKGYDWLVGHRPYAGTHREREPNRYDDPDSYEY